MQPLFGAIEAGGTKFVIAVGHSPQEIVARHVIPTTQPEETFAAVRAWFDAHGPLSAIGIASFGPVELDRSAPNWGYITDTTKVGWRDSNFAQMLSDHYGIPVGFDTDVNGAGLGESLYGAGQGIGAIVYLTVGTGIGGGLIINGVPVSGAGHPEMGHAYPRRDSGDQDFAGHCIYHGDCMEGLASGPAIFARWGATLSDLPQSHVAHELVASYIAQLCYGLFALTSVERIILGGGVMQTPGLLERVQERTKAIGGNYLPGRDRQDIVRPGLGDNAGITGALILAERAAAGDAETRPL